MSRALSALHHDVKGAGPLLVLLHPIGLEGGWWRVYAEALSDRYQVMSVDLYGHGRSTLKGEWIRLTDHADAIAALIESYGGAAHVAGVSMGGMVAQTLAINHPDRVKSLALVSTLATIPDAAREAVAARGTRALKDGMQASIEETIERWVLPGRTASAFANRCRSQLGRVDPKSWSANWGAISEIDTLPRLAEVRCEALICTGREDISTTPAMATAISQQIPNSQLVLIDNAAHMGAFEQVEHFLPVLEKFLARVH